jgi:putative transposase
LDKLYPVTYLDGVMFSVGQDGLVVKRTAHAVFALGLEGRGDVLGVWIGEAEGSKFWMTVVSDLRDRGVEDVLIASLDGLPGHERSLSSNFWEAISTVYPRVESRCSVVLSTRRVTVASLPITRG